MIDSSEITKKYQMIPSSKIKRIVVWGLRTRHHTHRYIHRAFYENARKLGYPILWVEDEKKNASLIKPGDMIITAGAVGKMVPEKLTFEDYNLPIRDDVYYVLHHIKSVFTDKIKNNNFINLCVHNSEAIAKESNIEQWGPVTYFSKESHSLYRPWGTDLLSDEFKKPVFRNNTLAFWIGSIWNDKNNHGNIQEIGELKKILKRHGLHFIHLRFIPDWLNIFLVRLSRIAPAMGGRRQVEINYLPCRMFKNISYGQLGISNIPAFKNLFGTDYVQGNNMDEFITNALSLPKDEYIKKIMGQQEVVKNYTYKNAYDDIFRAFEEIWK